MVRLAIGSSLLICLLACQSALCSNILQILERPADGRLVAMERSILKLTCLVPTSQILDRLYWFVPSRSDLHVTNMNPETSPYVQVERTIPPKLILYVRDFSASNQGKYSCRFYDKRDASTRRLVSEISVQVSWSRQLVIEKADPEQWLKNGARNAMIYCRLSGFPAPTVSWIRNKRVIGTDAKYSYDRNGLQLATVNRADAGKYICRAEVKSSSFAKDIIIDVRVFEKPKITMPPTVTYPMVLTQGRDGYIDCKAEGNPKPKIFWYKEKKPNRQVQFVDPQRYFTNENTGRLRIFNVNYIVDSDVYRCVAALTSSAIQQNQIDMMDVKKQRIEVYLWPSFFHVDRPLNQWIDVGKKAKIVCSARANGNLQMQFQKYRDPFPYVTGKTQTEDPRIKVTQTSDPEQPLHHYLTLEIDNVKSEDSSNYTCIATNLGGNSSVNGTIKVEHKPTMLKNTTLMRLGWIRNTTNLTCISYGLPHPTWSWYRHGIVAVLNGVNRTFHVFSYDYDRHSQSWLQIRPDFGMERWIFDYYQCVATNRKGTGNETIRFSPASVPGPPSVSAIKITSSSISIKVSPPRTDGGMTVLYYLARYRALGNAQRSWYGPVEFPANVSVDFSGLISDTEYTFEIRARNLVGPSQHPAVVQRRTKAMTVPAKVQVISKPMSTYPYTYFLRWRVPHNGGEPLDGYRIRVRPVGATGEWRHYRPLFSNPNLAEYFIVDLEANTKYDLIIQAHSVKGFSPETRFVFQTPRASLKKKPDLVRGAAAVPQGDFSLLVLMFFVFLRF